MAKERTLRNSNIKEGGGRRDNMDRGKERGKTDPWKAENMFRVGKNSCQLL